MPEKHAHWVKSTHPDPRYDFYVCSKCGEGITQPHQWNPYDTFPECPYCGEPMDETEKEKER